MRLRSKKDGLYSTANNLLTQKIAGSKINTTEYRSATHTVQSGPQDRGKKQG